MNALNVLSAGVSVSSRSEDGYAVFEMGQSSSESAGMEFAAILSGWLAQISGQGQVTQLRSNDNPAGKEANTGKNPLMEIAAAMQGGLFSQRDPRWEALRAGIATEQLREGQSPQSELDLYKIVISKFLSEMSGNIREIPQVVERSQLQLLAERDAIISMVSPQAKEVTPQVKIPETNMYSVKSYLGSDRGKVTVGMNGTITPPYHEGDVRGTSRDQVNVSSEEIGVSRGTIEVTAAEVISLLDQAEAVDAKSSIVSPISPDLSSADQNPDRHLVEKKFAEGKEKPMSTSQASVAATDDFTETKSAKDTALPMVNENLARITYRSEERLVRNDESQPSGSLAQGQPIRNPWANYPIQGQSEFVSSFYDESNRLNKELNSTIQFQGFLEDDSVQSYNGYGRPLQRVGFPDNKPIAVSAPPAIFAEQTPVGIPDNKEQATLPTGPNGMQPNDAGEYLKQSSRVMMSGTVSEALPKVLEKGDKANSLLSEIQVSDVSTDGMVNRQGSNTQQQIPSVREKNESMTDFDSSQKDKDTDQRRVFQAGTKDSEKPQSVMPEAVWDARTISNVTPTDSIQSDTDKGTEQPIWSQISREILEKANSNRSQVRELDIQLNPAELGRVRISVMWEEGQVHLRIDAAEVQTGHVIQKHLPELRENLAQLGITCGMVEMGLGNQGNSRQNARDEALAKRKNASGGFSEKQVSQEGDIKAFLPHTIYANNRINVTA